MEAMNTTAKSVLLEMYDDLYILNKIRFDPHKNRDVSRTTLQELIEKWKNIEANETDKRLKGKIAGFIEEVDTAWYKVSVEEDVVEKVEKQEVKRISKRRKLFQKQQEDLFNTAKKLLSRKEEDSCDLFATVVNSRLKLLTTEQRCMAEKLMSEVLSYGKADQLTLATKVDVKLPVQRTIYEPLPPRIPTWHNRQDYTRHWINSSTFIPSHSSNSFPLPAPPHLVSHSSSAPFHHDSQTTNATSSTLVPYSTIPVFSVPKGSQIYDYEYFTKATPNFASTSSQQRSHGHNLIRNIDNTFPRFNTEPQFSSDTVPCDFSGIFQDANQSNNP